MSSVGEALIEHLVERGVEVVFGIPGVHTVELYRGLSAHNIRHVTPRHEQGAAFMADGYARVTGKPGVALLITGPGVTNALTPMAQARADSIPMLVISSVNSLPNLGKGLGHLHELPNQLATIGSIATQSIRIENATELAPAIERVFAGFADRRPGPAHIEIPLDVAKLKAEAPTKADTSASKPEATNNQTTQAVELLSSARSPVILAGGGMRQHNALLKQLAERLDAPTVLTVNARGLMHGHDLVVPASPSLNAVRELISGADVVLALGTELGQTDYDMYAVGNMAIMHNVIRVDICPEQLARHDATLKIQADAGNFTKALLSVLNEGNSTREQGTHRASKTRSAAFEEIGDDMQSMSTLLSVIRDTAPNSIMVGDSAQPIYAANLYYDHDQPGGWFNAATGYGALGYAIPAAIGAAIAAPKKRIICITGDGGAQFSLPELMAAVDEKLPITFIIWNNHGYREIETSMQSAGVTVVGCDPTPPNFELIAAACQIHYLKSDTKPENVTTAVSEAATKSGPVIVEIEAL